MCGIVGIISNRRLTRPEKQTFSWMLYACRFRGVHGTGLFWEEPEGVFYIKDTLSPEKLMETYDDSFDTSNVIKGDISYVVGHCRQKTVGATSLENCHPFLSKDGAILGVHNGTVHRHQNQIPEYFKSEVDSQAIFEAFSNGYTVDQLESDTETDFTLVWRDDNDSTLNFARNDYRPLRVMLTEDKQTLYFASETWMITRSLQMANRSVKISEARDMPVGTQWSFPISDKGMLQNTTERKFEIKERHKPRPLPAPASKPGPYHSPGATKSRANEVKPPVSWTDSEWEAALSEGCQVCSVPIEKKEFDSGEPYQACFTYNLQTPVCGVCRAYADY